MKAKVRMGTWNAHTFESSKAVQIAKEMRRYSIEVPGWESVKVDGMEWKWTLSTVNWRGVNNLLRYCHSDDNHRFWSGCHDVLKSIEGFHAVGANLLLQVHDSKIQIKGEEGHNHTMLRYTTLCTYK
ncbi:unnamed protein product [Heterobilharzia americana]|nr:unnamed protein product [Heterobilharzia americana]